MKLVAAILMLAASVAFAADGGTPAQAEAMVKKAIAHYKKVGAERAFHDFSDANGAFVDRDLYVAVLRMDGVNMAHINQKTVGKNLMDLRDPDGKPHIRERIEAARTGGKGWQEFKFFNPVTKKIEHKTAYWERVDDMLFTCGAYKPL